jgi:ribonuclease Z
VSDKRRPRGTDAAVAPTAVEEDVTEGNIAALLREESAARVAAAVPQSRPLPSRCVLSFLGTSSAIPSKYRNVSGIWLQGLPERECPTGGTCGRRSGGVLLDCGEGSFGQLLLRFGSRASGGARERITGSPSNGLPRGVEEALSSLSMVWISHMHADHHLGLVRILRERPTSAAPLVVIGPSELEPWLEEVSFLMPLVRGRFSFFDAELFVDRDILHCMPPAPLPTDVKTPHDLCCGVGYNAGPGAGAGAGAGTGTGTGAPAARAAGRRGGGGAGGGPPGGGGRGGGPAAKRRVVTGASSSAT